jgi:hypothetical protein
MAEPDFGNSHASAFKCEQIPGPFLGKWITALIPGAREYARFGHDGPPMRAAVRIGFARLWKAPHFFRRIT